MKKLFFSSIFVLLLTACANNPNQYSLSEQTFVVSEQDRSERIADSLLQEKIKGNDLNIDKLIDATNMDILLYSNNLT